MKYLCRLPLLTIALFLSVTLHSPTITNAQNSFLPEPTGPYTVGTTLRHWVDEARPERYFGRDPSRGEFRELMVQIWYPGDIPPNVRMTPTSYFMYPEIEQPLFNEVLAAFDVDYELPLEFAESPTHSYLDIPLADAEAPYPIIILSPGLLVPPTTYHSQVEELASHGYIVAGIYHTYTTSATVFPDGTAIPGTAELYISAYVWSVDQRFVLDQLEALNADDPDGMFTDRIDVTRVGVYGHSYGGEATNNTMIEDERFSVAITMDDSGSPARTVDRPRIAFIHDNDELVTVMEEQISAGVYTLVLRFEGYRHGTFFDCPLWPNVEGITSPGLQCAMDDPLRTIEVTNAFIRGYFDKYLKGEDVPLFDGTSDEYPEVEFFTADPA